MPEYRAYQVGLDGHFVGFEPLVCTDDDQATERARRLVDGHDVELWSGPRFVTRLNRDGKPGASSHEVIDGRMVPKK
jgi:hypothetical protein